ncbi:hypothetical protein H4R34_005817, partial [Dimargaris verticillata]
MHGWEHPHPGALHHDVPVFDGTNWREFRAAFVEACSELGYEGDRKCRFLLRCTKPALQREIRQTCGFEDRDWEALERDIQALFHQQNDRDVRDELLVLAEKGCTLETLPRFTTQFEYAWRQVWQQSLTSAREKVVLYLKALPSTLRDQVTAMTAAMVATEAGLTYEQVKAHAERLARHQLQFERDLRRLECEPTGRRYPRAEQPPVATVTNNEEEDMSQMRQRLERLTLQTAGAQPSRAPQRQCPYCDDRGHGKRDCQFLTEDLRAGRVRLGFNNMVETSGGQPIPLNYNRGGMRALLPTLTQVAQPEVAQSNLVTATPPTLSADSMTLTMAWDEEVNAEEERHNQTGWDCPTLPKEAEVFG